MYSNATPINLSSLQLYAVVCLFLTAHTLDEAPMRIHYSTVQCRDTPYKYLCERAHRTLKIKPIRQAQI